MDFLCKNWATLVLIVALAIYSGASLATNGCPICALTAATREALDPSPPASQADALSQGPWSVPTIEGGEIRSQDLQGKVALIAFWATWCPSCLEEVPTLVELRNSLPSSEVAIITALIDHEATDLDGFVREHGINFDVALPTPSLKAAVGAPRYLPTLVLVDPQGVPRIRHTGLVDAQVLRRQILSLYERPSEGGAYAGLR